MSTPSTPEDAAIPDPPATAAAAAAVEDDRVYLVPLRWWKEAQESSDEEAALGIPYTASPAPSSYGNPMRLIGHIFNSDLVFNLKKDEESTQGEVEGGVSGRSYALIPSDMWASALKWHNDSHLVNNNQSSMFADDGMVDVYPLMLKISVMRDANIMSVKITKKDNVDNYKRAFKIFSVDSEVVRICDFSGQTNLIFMNEWNKMPQDGRQLDQEILLQIQVYALSESMTCSSEVRKFGSVSNGNIGNAESAFGCSGSFRGIGLGLTGLENLGNTCFMNSAVQCLAHTPKLVEYFLGDYFREINHHNPLGMDGEIALAFGDVLRKLWSSDKSPVYPRVFKSKISHFAPQFSGFNQHDSQELLAFLLDGLHEDLNRVKHKPYVEAKDSCGRPDEEVADEYWGNHLARNDSIIVDVCQGQYRSTLVCPICRKVSVTFDPFMYLSLPLPSSAMRTMTATVFSTDGSLMPSSFTINVPKFGKCKDFIQALSIACSLGDEEYLLVAEVYSGRIIRYLEDPSDLLSLIRDGDRLVAYRLPKDKELSLVVFTSQRMEEHDMNTSRWKAVGVPLITMLPSTGNGSTIRNLYLKLVKPFLKSVDNALHDDGEDKGREFFSQDVDMDASSSHAHSEATPDASEEKKQAEDDFQFYLTDEKSQLTHSKIKMDEPFSLTGLDKQLHVLVSWPDKALEEYDLSRLNSLPEIYKSGLFTRRSQEPVSLYACLEAFLKEEPLGPEDMWFCPSCKSHQQASKKLDLWRLPEVLVIHLKRFSYSRFLKNKLETFVDFPVHDLDLSSYIAHKTGQSHRYMLYAISNHYGTMGGGHYTAYVYIEGQNQWYDFDDSRVFPVSESSIKTSAAYVLFYKRVLGSSSDM